jgi:hypothetical protein
MVAALRPARVGLHRREEALTLLPPNSLRPSGKKPKPIHRGAIAVSRIAGSPAALANIEKIRVLPRALSCINACSNRCVHTIGASRVTARILSVDGGGTAFVDACVPALDAALLKAMSR